LGAGSYNNIGSLADELEERVELIKRLDKICLPDNVIFDDSRKYTHFYDFHENYHGINFKGLSGDGFSKDKAYYKRLQSRDRGRSNFLGSRKPSNLII
jgi:hypothetical protein